MIFKQTGYVRLTFLMVLYVKCIYTTERLWLRLSRLDGNVVVGRVRTHPGPLIGIPLADVIDIFRANT